ncbi:MAG: GtrA family protein [Salinibacterium sp.]|nr:GtrA family protein [Salinibacterium sp.]
MMRGVVARLAESTLVRFFVVALAGVLLDVAIFTLLVALGARPSVASIMSSSIAVCSTYFASSRLVFRVRYSPRRMLAYVVWYAISITGFALAIDTAWVQFGGTPTLWKLVSLPISFLVNFAVVNFVVLRRAPGDPEPRASL